MTEWCGGGSAEDERGNGVGRVGEITGIIEAIEMRIGTVGVVNGKIFVPISLGRVEQETFEHFQPLVAVAVRGIGGAIIEVAVADDVIVAARGVNEFSAVPAGLREKPDGLETLVTFVQSDNFCHCFREENGTTEDKSQNLRTETEVNRNNYSLLNRR